MVCFPSSTLKASDMLSSSCPCRRQALGGEGDNERARWLDSVLGVPEDWKFNNSIQLLVLMQSTNYIFIVLCFTKFSYGGAHGSCLHEGYT